MQIFNSNLQANTLFEFLFHHAFTLSCFSCISDKNQYVHRRDSVSLAALSEAEIQKRMRLGLVTHAPPGVAQGQEDKEMEDWEDIEEDGKESTSEETDEEDFVIDAKRRSSVDLDNMSVNSHDQDWENAVGTAAGAFAMSDYDPNKRHRSRKPMVASISEEAGAEDEEIATVDGDEAEDVELRDADGH